MTVTWDYLKFCWFILDFEKYKCYDLPHVTICLCLSYLEYMNNN